jgi:large subunit ribosomal protein L9|tara:strand:+ start:478 stop:1089 length:612 start_codon:yes stop_codon:yes gene_type:complete
MKVVFLEDVDGIAKGGEVKEVKNGFARNYLIPKKLATPATHNHLQRISKLSNQANEDRSTKLKGLSELSKALDGIEIKIEMRAASNKRLYGSVTGTMIADAINDQIDGSISRQLVQLDDPIREVGSYPITLRLYEDITAQVNLTIDAIGNEFSDLEESESDLTTPTNNTDVATTININENVSSDEGEPITNITETSTNITETE